MNYEKKTWADDDIITADDLNRMEEAIASAQPDSGTDETQE